MHTKDAAAEGEPMATGRERKGTGRWGSAPQRTRGLRRRRVLLALGSAGVVALAGCLGTGGSETDGAGADDGSNDDANEGTDDGDEDDANALFGRSARFADSYAFEMESLESGDEFRWSGRVDGEDSYMRMEDEDGVVEFYSVGDESYFVQDGGCFRMRPEEFEGAEGEAVDEPDIGTLEEEAAAHPELEAVGRDTIDGEEVDVFELSASEAAEHDEAVTYYVSVETGYLRRIEDEGSVMDFHSWGDVDPIEPPETECVEMGGWEEPGETPAFRRARGR